MVYTILMPTTSTKKKKILRWVKSKLVAIVLLVGLLFIASWVYDAVANRRYLQRIYVDLADSYEVVAFGDSLIEGIGAVDSYGFISRVADRLDLEIYNAGKRRMQTTEALERLDEHVLSFDPRLVILSIGGNDAIRDIPMETIRKNFFTLIERITDTGATVILLGVDPGGVSLYSYNEIYADLGQAFPDRLVIVEDFYDQIAYRPRYLFDPLHPNDDGHELLADYLEPIVYTTLSNLSGDE